MSDRMPDRMSKICQTERQKKMANRMPQDMSDRMPEDMPDTMSRYIPDRTTEDFSEYS